jgi:hypothetical protein
VLVDEDKPLCCVLRSEDLIESGGTQMMSKGSTVYQIVVRSELGERYAVAFEGMEMETKHGCTVLTGEIIDQPHLHGILDRINGLGLQLLSVHAFLEDAHPGTGGKREPKEPKQ